MRGYQSSTGYTSCARFFCHTTYGIDILGQKSTKKKGYTGTTGGNMGVKGMKRQKQRGKLSIYFFTGSGRRREEICIRVVGGVVDAPGTPGVFVPCGEAAGTSVLVVWRSRRPSVLAAVFVSEEVRKKVIDSLGMADTFEWSATSILRRNKLLSSPEESDNFFFQNRRFAPVNLLAIPIVDDFLGSLPAGPV